MAKFLFWLVIFLMAGLVFGGNRFGSLDIMSHPCSTENELECSKTGESTPQHHSSLPIIGKTLAHMTINSFAIGVDGLSPSQRDNQFHSDEEMVVALPTGWYNGGGRCLQNILISANGRSVLAKVVDECDSVKGGYADHGFQSPCTNNAMVAAPAVLKALDIPESAVGIYNITWSDA